MLQNNMNHSSKTFFPACLIAVMTLLAQASFAQQWDDKIIITNCNEQYILQSDKGNTIVKNKKEMEYMSNSGYTVYPETAVFYGDFITLDNVSGRGEKLYKNITPENVFYDDSKACIIKGYIDKKGKTCNASFERTFKDAKYFTRIYLLEDYFVKNKTLTITIPTSLAGYHIKEMNFSGYGIRTEHKTTTDADIYTYTLADANRMKDDKQMPPISNVYPYLLITGSFKDVNDLYTWSKKMASVDCTIPNLKALLQEINQNSKTDDDRISNTYHWIQEHIRYVAFEAGLSGHRPDTPQEVLRKRYGDCKGMALLLTTLLKAQGFDARLTDIGTDEIPFKMSDVPTLASANHVVCTLFYKGKTYYIDATCKHIPYTYSPQAIQGSQAMIYNDDKPLLQIVPTLKSDISIDSLTYQYRLQDNALTGKATYQLRGDMKEWFMSIADDAGNKNRDDLLTNNLNSDSHNMTITNAKWLDHDARHDWARFEGDVVNKAAVQQIDGELYIELNPHNNLFDGRIDTTGRVNDYYFPVRCNVVRQVTFTIPAGYKIDYLPSSATFSTPEGTLSCSFQKQGNTILFHQKMQIIRRRIPLADIPKWNEAVSKWKDASNEQVVLKK